MVCTKSDSIWGRVTLILITLHFPACLNSLRLKHVWSRTIGMLSWLLWNLPLTLQIYTSPLHTQHINKEGEKKESTASHSNQKQRKSPGEIINKRLQNGKKDCLDCTLLKSCSGGSGMWWKVVGSSGRIQAPDPLTLNSLWRTDPAALSPLL